MILHGLLAYTSLKWCYITREHLKVFKQNLIDTYFFPLSISFHANDFIGVQVIQMTYSGFLA